MPRLGANIRCRENGSGVERALYPSTVLVAHGELVHVGVQAGNVANQNRGANRVSGTNVGFGSDKRNVVEGNRIAERLIRTGIVHVVALDARYMMPSRRG